MAEVITKRGVNREQLEGLIEQLDFNYFLALDPDIYCLASYADFEFSYLERKINHRKRSGFDSIYRLKRVKLFSEKLQLEWREESDNTYQIVLIAADSSIYSGLQILAGVEADKLQIKREKKIYLWGELDYDEYQVGKTVWYEGQIPKLLEYPVDIAEIGNVKEGDKVRAFISVKEYQLEGLDVKLEHYLSLDVNKIN